MIVGVFFNGRMGNQLFQYFFLKYLRTRKKGWVYFFPNPHHAYFGRYFDLGWYDNLTLNAIIYSVFTRVLPKILPFRTHYMHNFVAPKPVEVKEFTIYAGFFQSDYYIKQLTDIRLPKIKEKYLKKFADQYGALFRENKIITVHIRRTDYLTYGKRDISLPISHFQRQLGNIENLDEYKVIFVSDDMPFVKNAFQPRDNFIFASNDEITDFQLIQHADIAIISNSTFAWWACYLSPKNNRVIAPKNWLGFRIGREHPKGIMTDRFEWVDVLPEEE